MRNYFKFNETTTIRMFLLALMLCAIIIPNAWPFVTIAAMGTIVFSNYEDHSKKPQDNGSNTP